MLLEPTIVFLDVALANLGVAVWNMRTQRFVYLNCLSTKSLAKRNNTYVAVDHVRRCKELTKGLRTIIGRFQPKRIVAELTTGGYQNANAAAALGMSVGLVSAVATCCKVPLYPIQPRETKVLVHGGPLKRGDKVSKEDVQAFVQKKFGEFPLRNKYVSLSQLRGLEHIADAMALAAVCEDRYPHILN